VGLEHLAGLTGLQTLFLSDTQVTDAGIEQLKQSRPKLNIQKENCSVEKSSECHFERAVGESRNLFFNRFLHFASLRDASVEMTVGLFNRAK
jgi:hypothetical protein